MNYIPVWCKISKRAYWALFIIKIVLLVAALGTLGLFYLGYSGNHKGMSHRGIIVQESLTKCQEITTVKGIYSDVVLLKKNSPLWILIPAYIKERVYIRLTVKVLAGIKDISEVQFIEDGEGLLILLPKAQVLSSDITSQEALLEQRNPITLVGDDMVFKGIAKKKDDITQEAIESGLLDLSQDRAKLILANIARAAGYTDVVVKTLGKDLGDKESLTWLYNAENRGNRQARDILRDIGVYPPADDTGGKQ